MGTSSVAAATSLELVVDADAAVVVVACASDEPACEVLVAADLLAAQLVTPTSAAPLSNLSAERRPTSSPMPVTVAAASGGSGARLGGSLLAA